MPLAARGPHPFTSPPVAPPLASPLARLLFLPPCPRDSFRLTAHTPPPVTVAARQINAAALRLDGSRQRCCCGSLQRCARAAPSARGADERISGGAFLNGGINLTDRGRRRQAWGSCGFCLRILDLFDLGFWGFVGALDRGGCEDRLIYIPRWGS